MEYLGYSFSYLNAAFELVKNNDDRDNSLHMLPALFCYRHAIELFLKFLSVAGKQKFNKDHNTKELIKTCVTILQDIDKKQFKKAANRFDIEQVTINKFILYNTSMLQKITKRYYFHLYVGKLKFEDKKNILLRYPDNLKLCKKIDKISKKEIEEIKKDIEGLRVFMIAFAFLFDSSPRWDNV